MKIECTVCKAKKDQSKFPKPTLRSRRFICASCNHKYKLDARITNEKHNPPMDIKVRKCLRCDQDFASINGYRVCYGCRELNKSEGAYVEEY